MKLRFYSTPLYYPFEIKIGQYYWFRFSNQEVLQGRLLEYEYRSRRTYDSNTATFTYSDVLFVRFRHMDAWFYPDRWRDAEQIIGIVPLRKRMGIKHFWNWHKRKVNYGNYDSK